MIQIPNKQNTDDASNEAHAYLARVRSLSDLPNTLLIQNAGKSPPGQSRSSGSSQILHPDINRIPCNDNIINNKEEIIYNKAKANYKF